MSLPNLKTPKPAHVDVGVIGLGISSIRLLKLLDSTKDISYRCVTMSEFGIWDKVGEHGENFDLVSTIESSNFSDWSFDYKFPFYSAQEYSEKLRAEVTPSIRANKIVARVNHIVYDGQKYELYGTVSDKLDNVEDEEKFEKILTCSHLVSSIGFNPDPNILANLKKCEKLCDSTVLIRGYSDTANMYISRLVLNGNRVFLASDNFATVDKMSDIGIREKESGACHWAPFDQLEPFHHLMHHNEVWHESVLWQQIVSPWLTQSTLLGRIWRWRIGLSAIIPTWNTGGNRFPGNSLWNLLTRRGISQGMFLPAKYWPVDCYFDYYANRGFKRHMLRSKIFLNDIYLFMMMGLVKLARRDRIVEEKGKPGVYRLLLEEEEQKEIKSGEAGPGIVFKPDLVLSSTQAKHRALPILYNGSKFQFEYSQFLFGNWSMKYPNLYFLGTTRPTTGAFASMAEMASIFVFELITNRAFRSRMEGSFAEQLAHWRRNFVDTPRSIEKIKETNFAGQYCESIAQLLNMQLDLRTAAKHGLWEAYFAGPDNMLRYTISGPYAKPGAVEKYKRQCDKICGPDARRIQFEILYPHIAMANLFVVFLSFLPVWVGKEEDGESFSPKDVAECQPEDVVSQQTSQTLFMLSTVLLGFPVMLRCGRSERLKKQLCAGYTWIARAISVFTMPLISYSLNYDVLRMICPLILIFNATHLHAGLGILALLCSLPLYFFGVCVGSWPPKAATVVMAVLALGAGLALHNAWSEHFEIFEASLVRTGLVPGFVAVMLESAYVLVFTKRMIFNDPRGKLDYGECFSSYLRDYKAFVAKEEEESLRPKVLNGTTNECASLERT